MFYMGLLVVYKLFLHGSYLDKILFTTTNKVNDIINITIILPIPKFYICMFAITEVPSSILSLKN